MVKKNNKARAYSLYRKNPIPTQMDLAAAQFGYDDGETRWMENLGNGEFKTHMLQNLSGPINVEIVDIDEDKDLDLFAVSAFNLWEDPAAQSFIWLENVGNMEYIRRDITNDPTHLMIMQTGDFNQDGLIDFITGGMYPYPPFDRMSRVTLWTNDGTLVSEN